jgi:hypothetical protein
VEPRLVVGEHRAVGGRQLWLRLGECGAARIPDRGPPQDVAEVVDLERHIVRDTRVVRPSLVLEREHLARVREEHRVAVRA